MLLEDFGISEIRTETVNEFQKSQAIRIVDVFVIAPICVYAGIKAKGLPKLINFSLVFIGIATFYYNGKNYLINAQNSNQNKNKNNDQNKN
jgi:hypothetical protein